MSVRTRGAREWLDALRDLAAGLDALPHAAAARRLADAGRRRAPRRTGRLAAAITTTGGAAQSRVSVPVGYALPVHAGTRHMPANPFLWHDDAAAEALDVYRDHLDTLTQ